MKDSNRIVFLDYLRVIACFMVMAIHASEPYYLAFEDGVTVTKIASRFDALCIPAVEGLCRVCVPLFVMASGYLLFPLTVPTVLSVLLIASSTASFALSIGYSIRSRS